MRDNAFPKCLMVGSHINFDLEKVCPGETTVGSSISRFGICYENGDIKAAISHLKENGVAVAELSKMVCQIVEEYGILAGKPAMAEYVDVITDELIRVIDPYHTTLLLKLGAAVLVTAVD